MLGGEFHLSLPLLAVSVGRLEAHGAPLKGDRE